MSEYVVHEEEYKGLTIKILPDDDPQASDPMDIDMLGKQVYWHRRMNLGHCPEKTNKYNPIEFMIHELIYNYEDKIPYPKDSYCEDWLMEDDARVWKYFEKFNLVIPVSAYEHGGITISASGRRAGWDSFDSGQLGFVYVSHTDILKEFNKKRITKKLLEKAEKILISEVEIYDSYLRGEIYGYTIEDESGEVLDSCWGFLGDYKYCLDEAKSAADYWAEQKEKEIKLYDERMLA